MSAQDGGTAFPAKRTEKVSIAEGSHEWIGVSYPGLSIRDYFAGQALNGMLSASWTPTPHSNQPSRARSAAWAYEWADAMLAERSKA